MWIVTGGAGFIGSNLIQALNGRGHTEILVVDRRNENFENLNDLRFANFMQPEEFLQALGRNALPGRIEAILHQGACADTTCTDEPSPNLFSTTTSARFFLRFRAPSQVCDTSTCTALEKNTKAAWLR